MRKKIEIQLSQNWIEMLQNLPETGMGYQIVNLILANGKVFNDVTVLNCSIAILDEEIDATQIENIELSAKRK